MAQSSDIDPAAVPGSTGCEDCLAGEGSGWWFHLRRCAACGHIGCCDSSPSQHASAHFASTGHAVIRSFEPGEDWFWDYRRQDYADGPALAPPLSRPADQPAPGPAGRVPRDWQSQLRG